MLLEYVGAKLLLNSMVVEFGYDKSKSPVELSVLGLKLKSLAIDTDANYKPIDLVCSEHYM